jgi:hypothetical protein
MTALPAAGLFTNAATTNGGAKQAQDDMLARMKEMLGGSAESELTIATGVVTPAAGDAGQHTIDTEADAATDDLTHIAVTNLTDGATLVIGNNTNGRDVVVKHGSGGAGQILLADSVDLTLDNTGKKLWLQLVGTAWEEIGRFMGAGSFARKQATVTALTDTGAPHTLTADDDGKLNDCDANSADFTINLTAVASLPNGCEHAFIMTGASGAVTIDPAGAETINGASTLVLRSQYQFLRIRSDGTAWHIVGGHMTSTPPIIRVRDEKSDATGGGGFTSGSWVTRDLNTTVVNEIDGASLATNQVTLPAGKYRARGRAPAQTVANHRVRLQDITNTATLVLG